jgi:hypothetical protein
MLGTTHSVTGMLMRMLSPITRSSGCWPALAELWSEKTAARIVTTVFMAICAINYPITRLLSYRIHLQR